MSGTAADALERLRVFAASGELAALCEKHGIDLIVAFGSSTDERRAAAAADVDVAVRFATPSRDVVGVTVALQDLLGFEPVDVMNLARASVVARYRALVGTLPLFESTRGLFAETQMAAILGYMDTAPMRRADVALMARST